MKRKKSIERPPVQSHGPVMKGILKVHPRGFGFVVPEPVGSFPQDVFIPKQFMDSAVDGDLVEVLVDTKSRSEKGPEGKIHAVLTRGRTHLAGIIKQISSHGEIMAYVPILGIAKPVLVQPPQDRALQIGDRITLKVVEWGDHRNPTLCSLSHYLGHISDAKIDVPAAVEEFGIRSQFPQAAIDQAKEYGSKVTKQDCKGREDLTKLETFTIDPDTARDYDDALSINKHSHGYHLAVHIADVAHYVKEGTPLDLEAKERSNSTYFPGTCVPMLPEELSNELCSLKAGVVRLVVSVLIDFDFEGTVRSVLIKRAYIKSAKRFTYLEAKAVIDGKKPSPHAQALQWMVELCLLLKKKRHQRGSIDFSLPEAVLLVDPQGEPTGIQWVEYDISHQLVEEFMLKANEMVAKNLADRGKEVLYRVHEEPTQEDFEDFFVLARSYGFPLPSKPTIKDIQKVFEMAKGSPHAAQLSVAFIRSMKLAIYSPDNPGHYGLALEHYCHFTSPIRRYSDLVTQRLLFDEEPEEMNLHLIALRCSEAERTSFKAESSVKLLKKLRLLKKYQDKDPAAVYAGLITRVKPFGLFFELKDLMVEGFLHISELEDDYFQFDERTSSLVGERSGKVHKVGEALEVQLIGIDLVAQESAWALVTPHKRRKRR